MRSFNLFTDHVSSLPADAVKAAAHAFFSPMIAFAGGKTASVPSKLLVGDPTLLSGSRGYPNSGLAIGMNNQKRPLSFKVDDFTVANRLSFHGVYDFNEFGTNDKLGFNPKSVNNHTQGRTCSQFDNCLHRVGTYQDAVCTKKNYQYIRTAGPRKIASGAKSFIHNPSIAGETK